MVAGIPATATVTVTAVTTEGIPATATVNVTAVGSTAGTPATATVNVTAVTNAGLFYYDNGPIYRPGMYLYDNGTVTNFTDGGTVAPTPTQQNFGYVGDSLTVGGLNNGLQGLLDGLGYGPSTLTKPNGNQSYLVAAKLRADGLVGRSIVDGVAPYIPSSQTVIAGWRADNFHPTFWTVALISNDFGKSKAQIKTSVNTLLDVIDNEPVTKVLWVGPVVRPGSTLQSQVDTNMYPALNEIVAERAGLVALLNLQTAIRNRGLNEESPALWTDDRHMTAAGYTLRNTIIRDFIAANLTDTVGTPAPSYVLARTEQDSQIALAANDSDSSKPYATAGYTQVVARSTADAPFTLTIQSSTDGATWATAGSASSTVVNGLSTASVTRPVTTPYVRMLMLCSSANQTNRSTAIDFYTGG